MRYVLHMLEAWLIQSIALAAAKKTIRATFVVSHHTQSVSRIILPDNSRASAAQAVVWLDLGTDIERSQNWSRACNGKEDVKHVIF